MKKLFLLSLTVLFVTACSTDDSLEILNQEKAQKVFFSAKAGEAVVAATKPGGGDQPIVSCFSGFAAHTEINVSGGLNNPIVNFVADFPSTVALNASFYVTVEVQQLADCEDFNLTTGSPIFFGTSTPYTNVVANRPTIAVLPNQLPVCYKWRIFVERAYSLTTPCKSYSPWYDAPLF